MVYATDQDLADKWRLLKIRYFQMFKSPARDKILLDMKGIEDEMHERGYVDSCAALRKLSGVK